ncbi:hypothetical protein KUTeg_009011 [Tegillarca granosa]|uniref:Uncharacterized protein n=1 Tax=Tegillarca granosa TaxID=220873 RepID=A0ABQ9FAZ1_TEGGR|nr:hypothetical protein KUTeg_009011 [Tegillarca granosa]
MATGFVLCADDRENFFQIPMQMIAVLKTVMWLRASMSGQTSAKNKSCYRIPVKSDSDSDPFELNQPIVAVGATQSNPNSSNDKCGDTSSESECDDSSSDSEYVVSSSDSEYDDTSSDSEYVVSSSDSEYDDTSSDSEYVVSSLENEDDVSSSENEDDVSSSENKDEMEEVLTRREDQCDDACDDIQDCLNDISTKTVDDASSFEKDLIQREDGRDDGDEYCPTELSTESSRDGDNSSKKDLIQKKNSISQRKCTCFRK